MSLLQKIFNPLGALLSDTGGATGRSPLPSAHAMTDAHGRPLPANPPKPAGGPTITVRVEDLWSTHPSAGLTPQKLASILNEADDGYITRAMQLAEEIEAKSPRILAAMRDRKLAVQQLEWTVTPASDSREDKKIAAFVRKNLEDADIGEAVGHMQDSILKGFSALWINWRIEGEQVWLHALDWAPQARFTFTPRDVNPQAAASLWPRLLTAQEPVYGEELEQWRWLISRDAARSTVLNKAGLWRTVAWFYLFSNFSMKDWIVFLDTLGVPLMVGKYPTGMETKEIEVLKAAIKAAAARGVVFNDQALLEIVESKTTSTEMHERLARYCDEQISIAIVGQTASTQGTPGRLGGDDAELAVRKSLIVADARIRAREIRQQVIWPLVAWNFGPDKFLPHFEFAIEEPEDQEQKSRVYKTLVEIGVPITRAQAQAEFHIRPAEGDEPLLQPPRAVPSPLAGEGQGGGAFAAFHPLSSAPPSRGRGQEAAHATEEDPTPISSQADRMDLETEVAWNAVMDRIVNLVNEAESLPSLRDALLASYSDLPTDRLAEIMSMGFAAAELAGRFAVEEEK